MNPVQKSQLEERRRLLSLLKRRETPPEVSPAKKARITQRLRQMQAVHAEPSVIVAYLDSQGVKVVPK